MVSLEKFDSSLVPPIFPKKQSNGGLAYSATTVVELSTLAFHKRAKAWGFTILLEGVLLGASTTWLSVTALAYLVLLNAVGTAVSVTRPPVNGG